MKISNEPRRFGCLLIYTVEFYSVERFKRPVAQLVWIALFQFFHINHFNESALLFDFNLIIFLINNTISLSN